MPVKKPVTKKSAPKKAEPKKEKFKPDPKKQTNSIAKKCGFETVSDTISKDGKRYGCSVGKDKDGYFVYTHRARSKSYESKDKIPKSKIIFIDSTG